MITQISQQRVEELLLTWQHRLSLRDWDINISLCKMINLPDYWGEISFNLQERIANIKLRYPEEVQSNAMRPYDLEGTLIHELLHLHLASIQIITESEETAQEQAINAIAKTLVNLGRIEND